MTRTRFRYSSAWRSSGRPSSARSAAAVPSNPSARSISKKSALSGSRPGGLRDGESSLLPSPHERRPEGSLTCAHNIVRVSGLLASGSRQESGVHERCLEAGAAPSGWTGRQGVGEWPSKLPPRLFSPRATAVLRHVAASCPPTPTVSFQSKPSWVVVVVRPCGVVDDGVCSKTWLVPG